MKKIEFIDSIKDFGLSENEAKVYVASLSLGPSTVLKIAKEAEIKRTTTYAILESLKTKGLIVNEIKGLKNLYTAEGPERLEEILEDKKEKFREILPELEAIHNLKGGESFIKYYEGVAGVKTVYDHILDGLKPGDDYMIISDMEQFLKMDREYFTKFIERRVKYNLKVRTIIQNSESGRYYKTIEVNTNQKIKFLSEGTKLTANLVITPHRVIITQIIAPIVTIIIENKSIVEMQKEQFEIIWNTLEDVDPNAGKLVTSIRD